MSSRSGARRYTAPWAMTGSTRRGGRHPCLRRERCWTPGVYAASAAIDGTPSSSGSKASSRNGEGAAGSNRSVSERSRARPRDVGEPALLLERRSGFAASAIERARGSRRRAPGRGPTPGLRPVRRGERQRGVVAAQPTEALAPLDHGGAEAPGVRRAQPGRPASIAVTSAAGVGPCRAARPPPVRSPGRPPPAAAEAPQQGPRLDPRRGRRLASRRSRSPSMRGSSIGSGRSGARNGRPRSRQVTTAGSSSGCPGQHGPGGRVGGQVVMARRRRGTSSDASGARTPPGGARRATIRFANRSVLCSTRRTARATTGAGSGSWSPGHASQARQRAGEPEDSPHVREPPPVDRLVVVPDEEHAVGGRREEEGDLELRAIEVLRLIDQHSAHRARQRAAPRRRHAAGAAPAPGVVKVHAPEAATARS